MTGKLCLKKEDCGVPTTNLIIRVFRTKIWIHMIHMIHVQ